MFLVSLPPQLLRRFHQIPSSYLQDAKHPGACPTHQNMEYRELFLMKTLFSHPERSVSKKYVRFLKRTHQLAE